MFAIVTFVLGIFPDVEKITPKNLETLEWAGECFAETPVKDVMKMVEDYEGYKLKVKPGCRFPSLFFARSDMMCLDKKSNKQN